MAMRVVAPIVAILLLVQWSDALEEVTKSYHELREKAKYDEVLCGVCKAMAHEIKSSIIKVKVEWSSWLSLFTSFPGVQKHPEARHAWPNRFKRQSTVPY